MSSVAIVIATFRRPDALREVVTGVLAQAPDDAEIVVVDQSEPPSPQPSRVRVLTRKPGLPAARNSGIAATTAPIVLFLDDDVRLHPGCIAAHLAAYRDPTVGGVVGRIVERSLRPNARTTTNRVDPGGRIVTRLDGPLPVEVDTLKGANMSFRRAALVDAGPFDERYGGTALLEDADLSTRVRAEGWRLVYAPDAAVDHLHLPVGGVRRADRVETERWRFRNTGYFVRRHRGRRAAPRLVATFGAIAVARAVRWGRPDLVTRLLAALAEGWAEAARTPSSR